jgi:hypothetical protein
MSNGYGWTDFCWTSRIKNFFGEKKEDDMCLDLHETVERYLEENQEKIADKLMEIFCNRFASSIEQEKIYEEVGCGKDRMDIAIEILNVEREFVTGQDVVEGIGHPIRGTLRH